jgi:hypothetical protein
MRRTVGAGLNRAGAAQTAFILLPHRRWEMREPD